MATTLEELSALREQMAAAGLSTAEIDAKIETLKGEMAIENDYPSILESVLDLIEPVVSKWPYKNKNLTFRFDNKGLSLAFSELGGNPTLTFLPRSLISAVARLKMWSVRRQSRPF